MIGSVHLADLGPRARWRALTTARPAHSHSVIAVGLGGSFLISPDLRRVGLIALWDNEKELDSFLATHPLADILDGGWWVRLAPVRASGTWPGLPGNLPRDHAAETGGPAAVLTLGRLRPSQSVRFRRASARAEARLAETEGVLWATGLARPPLVATFSLWRSTAALTSYAYRDRAHAEVLRARPFHRRSAFVRFRPYQSEGWLDGRNPLPADWAAREYGRSPASLTHRTYRDR